MFGPPSIVSDKVNAALRDSKLRIERLQFLLRAETAHYLRPHRRKDFVEELTITQALHDAGVDDETRMTPQDVHVARVTKAELDALLVTAGLVFP